MLKYISPRTGLFPAAALAGGLVMGGCAAPAPYNQGIAALSDDLAAHGYKKLGTNTDRDSVEVIVAVGNKCEGEFWMTSDTDVSAEDVYVDVVTNPDLGKKEVLPDGPTQLVYSNGNYPTNAELLRNPLVARACLDAAMASETPAP